MKQIKARLIMTVFIFIVVAVWVVYITFDANMLVNLGSLQIWSIFAALGLLAIGMYFDGYRLKYMAEIAGEDITILQSMEVVFGNYFLALITPGATGGPVAQILLLREAGIPTAKATALAIVRTLMTIFVLVSMLPIVFYFDTRIVPGISKNTLILVSAVFSILGVISMWLLKFRAIDDTIHYLAKRILGKNSPKVIDYYKEIKSVILLLNQKPRNMIKVLFYTFLSLLTLYSIVPVIFAGMGADVPWGTVLGRLVIINFLLYFVPTPGGTGAAEGGFIYLFGSMFPQSMVGITAILWRLFCEYVPFVIGLLGVIRVFGLHALKNKMFTVNEGGEA